MKKSLMVCRTLMDEWRSKDSDLQSMMFNLKLLQTTIDEALLNQLIYNDQPCRQIKRNQPQNRQAE